MSWATDTTTPTDSTVDILIVDDRVGDLAAMSEILAGPGYNVIGASSGKEALRRVLEQDFAVILLDVMMPTMDGFEVASLIRQRDRSRHTPIIFLTAAGPDLDKIYRGYSVGAVDYLSKPVDCDVVRAKVAIFAELARKNRRLELQAIALKEAERRERERMIEDLRSAAERRYLSLAEAIPQIVWTALPNGEWSYANRRWLEYTEIDLARARGWGWLEAVHPDDRATSEREWSESVKSGRVHEIECRLRRAHDGAYRWHLCRAVPEHEDGRVVAWLGTYTDFEELKQAIWARDEFLSVASHELRTPLTALKLRIQSLQRSLRESEPQRRRIDGAARQCDRLERLISDLLDVSRVTTGQFALQLGACDLREIVEEAVDRARDEATATGAAIELTASGSLAGVWDGMRIEQVVTNLIGNALKYGCGKPITVSVVGTEDHVEVFVEDRGIGIAEEDLNRIFARFERAGERSREGLGMGLYIAKEIVHAHGGRIGVESAAGEGSRFWVRLPRTVDLNRVPRRAPSEAPDSAR
jgi:PAS domain S-box-containing protein